MNFVPSSEKAKEKGIKIIRSFHDFNGIPNDIYSRVITLKKRGDIAKIAVTPKGILDTITLFNAESDKTVDIDESLFGKFGTAGDIVTETALVAAPEAGSFVVKLV